MWRCTCVLALLCTVLLRCSAHKRAEISPAPFVLISRYGRSSPRVMVPRSDRIKLFYMGARYGKRSDMGTGVAGGGGTVWRGECDCEQYAKRSPTSALYKRRMGEPERVPNED